MSQEQFERYIPLVLDDTNKYFVFVKANSDFDCMSVFYNTYALKNENIKNVKSFLFDPNLSDDFLSLHEIINKVKDKCKDIVIPDMITSDQAKLEEEEYKKQYKEQQRAIEGQRRESEKVKENQKEEIKYSCKEDSLNTSVVKTKGVLAIPKEQSNNYTRYTPWNFRPSKPVCNPVINSISIIGKNDVFLEDSNIESIKVTQKNVNDFLEKDIDMIFYPLDDNNIETLPLIGFRKIELLHEKFT